jgi:hypothetical protein
MGHTKVSRFSTPCPCTPRHLVCRRRPTAASTSARSSRCKRPRSKEPVGRLAKRISKWSSCSVQDDGIQYEAQTRDGIVRAAYLKKCQLPRWHGPANLQQPANGSRWDRHVQPQPCLPCHSQTRVAACLAACMLAEWAGGSATPRGAACPVVCPAAVRDQDHHAVQEVRERRSANQRVPLHNMLQQAPSRSELAHRAADDEQHGNEGGGPPRRAHVPVEAHRAKSCSNGGSSSPCCAAAVAAREDRRVKREARSREA